MLVEIKDINETKFFVNPDRIDGALYVDGTDNINLLFGGMKKEITITMFIYLKNINRLGMSVYFFNETEYSKSTQYRRSTSKFEAKEDTLKCESGMVYSTATSEATLINIVDNESSLTNGNSVQLLPTTTYENSTMTFASSNDIVAGVDTSTGMVTANSVGVVYITINVEALTITVKITVVE